MWSQTDWHNLWQRCISHPWVNGIRGVLFILFNRAGWICIVIYIPLWVLVAGFLSCEWGYRGLARWVGDSGSDVYISIIFAVVILTFFLSITARVLQRRSNLTTDVIWLSIFLYLCVQSAARDWVIMIEKQKHIAELAWMKQAISACRREGVTAPADCLAGVIRSQASRAGEILVVWRTTTWW